jgi:protein-disulfide isomerase
MLLSPMLVGDPPSLVGTTALTDLRVDSLVAADGALATYAATSVLDGARCTLRVALGVELPEDRDETVASALARLVRHAVGIGSLCQPRAAGAVVLGGRRLLAMAHLGTPLDSAEQRIRSSQPMALEEIAAVLEPVTAALTALHDQGLVHGAVHPGAVLLAPSGPVLSAFGLSELANLLGGPSAARDATPPRSRVPEQVGIVAASPSAESDTYAVAMIACELLVGRPFTAETDPGSIARAIDHPMTRPTPAALGLAVSEALDKAFAAALQTQPRERARSPRALLAALAAPGGPVSTHEPLHADAPPVSARAAVPRRAPDAPDAAALQAQRSAFAPRSPTPPAAPPARDTAAWLVYALVALGLLLLVGGAATVFVLAQRRVPPATPVVSAPALKTVPVPTPAEPAPVEPEPQESASTEPGVPAAPSSSAAEPPLARRAAGGLQPFYPEDLTALVPLARETPVIGSRDALVTIVVFADMQCPHTRQARGLLENLRRRYDADLRIAVRHLPIPSHDKADDAAEIAATVGAQAGPAAFWNVFERLTANQGGANLDDMLQSAEQSGAPALAVRRSFEEHVFKRIVDADRLVAQRLMVRATPAFFVNGKRADGALPQSKLAEMIDKELAASRAALTAGTPRAKLYSVRVTFNVTAGEADPPRAPAPRRH